MAERLEVEIGLTGADGLVVLEPIDDGRRIGVHFALDFVVRVTDRVLLSGGVLPGNGNCKRMEILFLV